MLDTAPLWEWVNERHAIYVRKALREGKEPFVPAGFDAERLRLPSGWLTENETMQGVKWCNVFRALDRTSVWVTENVSRPFADHPNLWFMFAVARQFNRPATIAALIESGDGWPAHKDFSLDRMSEVLARIPGPVFSNAYLVRFPARGEKAWAAYWDMTGRDKVVYINLGRLWEHRDEVRACVEQAGQTMQGVVEFLDRHPRIYGWGGFMAYQLAVEMRHSRYLRDAPDIATWSSVGIGSGNGLAWMTGWRAAHGKGLKQKEGLPLMKAIHAEQDGRRAAWVPPIELSDIQNCCCETGKYMRLKAGGFGPRQRYNDRGMI